MSVDVPHPFFSSQVELKIGVLESVDLLKTTDLEEVMKLKVEQSDAGK